MTLHGGAVAFSLDSLLKPYEYDCILTKTRTLLLSNNCYDNWIPVILTTLIFLGWNEWDTFCLVTENIHGVWFSNEFVTGPLKMWLNLLGQKYTHTNSIIWVNVPWPFSPHLDAFYSHPHFSVVLLLKFELLLYCFWRMFEITVLLEPIAPKTQSSGWWLQVFLENLEVIIKFPLLLHCSIYFLWSTRSTVSKRVWQFNSTTPMLDSRYGVLGVKSLTLYPPKHIVIIVAKQWHFVSSDHRDF